MKMLKLWFVALMVLAHGVPLVAATSTTTLHIEGMTCAGCETAVKLVLEKTPGVSGQQVSYEAKQAVVTYDASKTTPAKIAAAIADALSYPSRVARRRHQSRRSPRARAMCRSSSRQP